MTLREYLDERHGRMTELAAHLHVSVSLVSMWASGSRVVPIRFLVPIMKWSKRNVTRATLRPDVFAS